MQTVDCGQCHEAFSISLREKKHGKGITETYFTCPHCEARYTAFVTNAEIRRRQREIRKLHDSLTTITDFQKYQDVLQKIKDRESKLEPLMKDLKNKIQAKALT